MSKIGYIRVSTEHQETARQQDIMCSYQVDRIFSEKISGANKDRPQLRQCWTTYRTNRLPRERKISLNKTNAGRVVLLAVVICIIT